MSQENGFSGLDLSQEVTKAIARMGITTPTQIQTETIPPMMAGRDIIGIAPTGTGKTLAFGIPMLEYISLTDTRVQELVLAPTRELAMQITKELEDLAHFIPQVKIACIYGGQPMARQIAQLKRRPQIVVATPGRLLDMQARGHLNIEHVHTLVLDEADEMLKMGFVKDVTKIINLVPHNRQLVMFSATTNRDVLTISWRFQNDPVEITVQATKENRPQITQYTITLERNEKNGALQYLLDSDAFDRVMVFVNTKFMTQRVADRLQKQGYKAEALHGDIRQSQRTRIMNDYKRGRFPILVATDVAARGIDVDDVEAVVNYDLPNENEYYLHRIGRTGRAKKHGVAFTMLTFQESVRMDEILKYMQSKPTPLKFDEAHILRDEAGEAFFEDI